MTPTAELLQVKTQLDFKIFHAPAEQNRYRRPLTVKPEFLTIEAYDGWVRYVRAQGPTMLKGGGWGFPRSLFWSWRDRELIPDWVIAIVIAQAEKTGLQVDKSGLAVAP